MNFSSRLLLVILIPSLLAACTHKTGTTGNGAQKQSQTQSPAQSPAGANQAPVSEEKKEPKPTNQSNASSKTTPHGEYETVENEGQELRQGRYLVGTPGGRLAAVIMTADPKSFNPWVADDSFSLELCNLLFRGIADIDHSTGEVIPDMAAEITPSADKLRYKTRLRKGLTWSDGTKISSDDVAFTWNKIVAQGYGNPALREAALVDGKMPLCTVEDELTNTFATAKPSASFMRLLATLKIAPKHVVEGTIGAREGRGSFRELWQADKDTSQMVTSGPFKLVSYVPGDRVELGRSSNFYMIDKSECRLPYLDTLTYAIVPDAGSVVLSFGKKEADLAQIRPRDRAWLASQEKKENFKLFDLGPASSTFFLVFNMNQRQSLKTHKPLIDEYRAAWFNDTNFRQAVNHAINRAVLVKDFFKDAGTELFSSEPASSPYFNNWLNPFKQDLKLSQSLLSKSGFLQKGEGHLYDKNGNRVRFTLLYAKNSKLYDLTAHTIAESLKQLGITVDLELLEPTEVQDIANGMGPKTWEAQLFSLTTDPLDPNSSANVFRSNGRLHLFDQRDPDLHGNIIAEDARPWELRLDQIYEQASAEFDVEKRKQLYSEAQKIIYDEAPFIYLAAPNVIVAARNTVKNFSPTPLSQASLGLHNVEEIYIDRRESSHKLSAVSGRAATAEQPPGQTGGAENK